jgi:anti-sigma regulatory factor (Ser/Thr protein kinase)
MDADLRERLPHAPRAPGSARRSVEAAIGNRLPSGALAELQLVVSELVTNAVRHGAARDGAVELSLALRGEVVRVEVADGGHGFTVPARDLGPAPPGDSDAAPAGGWGLVVVDCLARRWGVEGAGGTRVWAEVQLASEAAGAGRGIAPVAGASV